MQALYSGRALTVPISVGTNLQSFYDGMTLVGSLVVMALVIAATYYASRWYARRMSKTASGRHIKIVDRVPVSPGCALIVVQAGDKFYLMGQSDKHLEMLCELNDFDPDTAGEPAAQTSFGQLLNGFLKKTPEDSRYGGNSRFGGNGKPKDDGGGK